MENKKLKIFFLLLTIVIISNLAVYIYSFGMYFPFWDQWELVEPLVSLYNDKYDFAFLFKQHNEHRIVFPRILMLSLAYFSHWNHALELFLGFFLGFSIFIFSITILYNFKNITDDMKFIFLLLSTITLLSIYQDENWLWGWQNQIFLSVLSTISVCYFLSFKNSSFSFIFSIFCAFVASFSFTNGLLVWIIGILIMIVSRKKIIFLFIWIITTISVFILYFYSYHSLDHHPSVLIFLQVPLEFFGYVITFLGGAIFPLSTVSRYILGSIGVLLFIFVSYFSILKILNREPYFIFGYGLAIFGILSACATAVGRCGFGMGQGHSSRYTTISTVFWYGLIIICSHLYLKMKGKIYIKYLFIAILICTSYCNIRFYIQKYIKKNEKSFDYISKLKAFENLTEEEWTKFYPNLELTKKRAIELKKYKLSVFRE